MVDLGIRMQLLIGPTLPRPAPFDVVDALMELEVENKDRDARDGFQMLFSLGKDSSLDYGLLREGFFDPPNRVVIMVFVGISAQVLIDGVITHHQVIPSNTPGESTLYVTGRDIGLQLDLEEKNATFKNMSDSAIVEKIIGSPEYVAYGLKPQVTRTTEVPVETSRIRTQQGTDLAYIQELAGQNGFVFYIEPTLVPGVNTAYWGVENRGRPAQPPLSMNMGPDTNVDSPITFSLDALGPAAPQVTIVEPLTRTAIPIPVPSSPLPSLTGRPATPLRRTIPRNAANLDTVQALLQAVSVVSASSSDAVTANGQVDAVRYGRVLQSRRLVGVRGVGSSYNGEYYVTQVKHRIKRGQYTQSFQLRREGRGATSPTVTT
ncbi:MAG TPA: hypothetical protein VHM69_02890 [Rubrobacter sp.]|nr:hypothetical protein [Rubrobacter sp.]